MKIKITFAFNLDQQENTLFYEIGWDNKKSTREKSLSNLFSLIDKFTIKFDYLFI